jgi:hypothetical protein
MVNTERAYQAANLSKKHSLAEAIAKAHQIVLKDDLSAAFQDQSFQPYVIPLPSTLTP